MPEHSWVVPSPPTIGVLLVDDQPAMLRGLEILIDGEQPRMKVVGSAAERERALAMAAEVQPDVILLDLDLAGELSLDFLADLLRRCTAAVLIFTGVNDRAIHARALREGAVGVVMKEEKAEVLLDAIARSFLLRRDVRERVDASWIGA